MLEKRVKVLVLEILVCRGVTGEQAEEVVFDWSAWRGFRGGVFGAPCPGMNPDLEMPQDATHLCYDVHGALNFDRRWAADLKSTKGNLFFVSPLSFVSFPSVRQPQI